MKKLFALLLAAAVLFALCACGSTAPAQNTEAEPAEEAEAVAEAEAEPEPAEEEETVTFQKGTVNGNTYESKLFGIGCTLDDSWVIADEEQVAQIMGIATDLLSSDEDMASYLESGSTFCDLYAVNNTSGSSINIQVTKAEGPLAGVQLALMSKQDIIDATYDQMLSTGALDTISSSLGMSDAEMTKSTVQFCGEECPCIRISGTIAAYGTELPFNEAMVYVVSGNYIGTVTAGDFSGGDIADVLSGFHTL